MRTADFHFDLPPELIAQQPAPQRDQSRLLVLHRDTGRVEHRRFRDLLEFLRAGDVLVLNNSRVIPARLRGVNAHTGGAFEMLLLEENATNDWWVMLKPGKRARVGTQIQIGNRQSAIANIKATVIETNDEGHRRLRFDGVRNILDVLDELGEVPLPPYIRRDLGTPNSRSARPDKTSQRADQEIGAPSANATHDLDRERYQTVFAQTAGSVAAPTAGLHFTESLLEEIRARGVETHFVTLHVGLGTFAPVKAETLAAHTMHEERFEVSEATARAVNEAKAANRRVIAVGTTSVRVLESAALTSHEPTPVPSQEGSKPANPRRQFPSWEGSGVGRFTERVPTQHPWRIAAGHGRTKIFIHSPYDFKIADVLLTNFHLPCSTLLMLVSAFAAPGQTGGREMILSAYAEAIRERYRFFSYGDAMLLL